MPVVQATRVPDQVKMGSPGNAGQSSWAQDDSQDDSQCLKDEEHGMICRICLEDGGPDLIAPCYCKGSQKWVHRSCIDKWRVIGLNPTAFTHCHECSAPFLLCAKPSMEAEQTLRTRKCRIIAALLGNFVIGFVSLQIMLFVLSVVVRLADPDLLLVRVFNYKQDEAQMVSGLSSDALLDSLRHHKATYYTFAIILACFFMGIAGLVYSLVWACRPRNDQDRRANQDFCDDCVQGFLMYQWTADAANSAEGHPSSCLYDCLCCNCCREGADHDHSDCLPCLPIILFFVVIAIMVIIFVGAFISVFLMVGVTYKMTQQIVRIRQMRYLVLEYEVQDLSAVQLVLPAHLVINLPDHAPLQRSSLCSMKVEDGFKPCYEDPTPPETKAKVTEDLYFVLGKKW